MTSDESLSSPAEAAARCFRCGACDSVFSAAATDVGGIDRMGSDGLTAFGAAAGLTTGGRGMGVGTLAIGATGGGGIAVCGRTTAEW